MQNKPDVFQYIMVIMYGTLQCTVVYLVVFTEIYCLSLLIFFKRI